VQGVRRTIAWLGLILAAVLVVPPAQASDYRHRMPQPPSLVKHRAPCPDEGDGRADGKSEIGACADPTTGRVWVAPGLGRFAWSHEIGHVWWEQVAAERDRRWITYKLGWPRYTEWCGGEHGMPTPCELAADAYAACDLGLTPAGRWETSYGYLPTVRQHRRICNAIVAIGLARR
jgi:hypothetical protein